MTGHQPNPGTGSTLQRQATDAIPLEPLVRALGIKHVETVDSYDLAGVEKAFKELMATNEPAVMVARHACALLPEMRKQYVALEVIEEKCTGCGVCFRIGCPAILKADEVDASSGKPLAVIDRDMCTGCEICAQVCPHDAITFRDQIRLREDGAATDCALPTPERS
jgi:indolepyruvate ferredoxin oxidoreductase alpha subunit